MRLLIILLAFALSACCHQPDLGEAAPVSLPPLPATIAAKPKQLPMIIDQSLKGVVMDDLNTSKEYRALALRYEALVRLYECSRIAIINRKDSQECFDK